MQAAESLLQGLFSEIGLKENDLNSKNLSNIPSLVSKETNEDLWRHLRKRRPLMLFGQWSRRNPEDQMDSLFIFIEFVGQ